MDLVIDANILFSALIKDSMTADLLFREELNAYAPEFILQEFAKYREVILEKTSRDKMEFEEILAIFKEIISIIPKEEYTEFMDEARKISPDPDDEMYFALAIKLNCPLWSNDRRLRKQDRIAVYSTTDIVAIL